MYICKTFNFTNLNRNWDHHLTMLSEKLISVRFTVKILPMIFVTIFYPINKNVLEEK